MINQNNRTNYPGPVFSQPWWLDAVAPGQWKEIVIEKGGSLFARMPYVIKRGKLFTSIIMPPLTQTLGPWLRDYPGKRSGKLHEEKELMLEMIKKLPKFDYFHQNFSYLITNWLPFYWSGYEQTTRYTYILDNLDDLDSIYSGFSRAKRRNIDSASETVSVKMDLPSDDFYKHHVRSLAKEDEKIVYSYDLFKRIYHASYENNAGKTFFAIDKIGRIHSAIFVIWNEQSSHYLISTIDPDLRSSGSATLLIWEAIKYLADKTRVFDFEGSMIEGVENSFRAFGAKQTPYFQICKTNSKILKIFRTIKRFV